jgi:methyl-accepting chemotaxis protein
VRNEHIKRKKYLLHKSFQLKYVILGIFLLLFTIGIVQVNLYYQSMKLLLQQPELTGISFTLQKINAVFIGWFIIGTILIIYGGLTLSHRMIGPLKRLQINLVKVGQGDFTLQMQTRKNDEFKEVNFAFNEMMLGLRKVMFEEKKLLRETNIELQSIIILHKNDNLNQANQAEIQRRLEQLSKKEEKLLSSIKI